MIGRIIFFVITAVLLTVGWKTGVLESIRSGGIPEIGRECTVSGPVRMAPVPVAAEPAGLGREIATHTGVAASEKAAVAGGLQTLYDNGDLALIPANSKVKVIENGSVTVELVPYATVKVRILGGKLKDAEVWIERLNLVDTPVQGLFQNIRQQEKK